MKKGKYFDFYFPKNDPLHLVDKSQTSDKQIAWLLQGKSANFYLNPKFVFVMNALEERQKTLLINASKSKQHLVVEPPRSLFKVVVNNYRQQEKNFNKNEIDEPMLEPPQGLPPQPTGYLKFPEYDWF